MPFLSLQTYLKGKARILGFPKQPFAFLTTFWIGVERGFNGFNHNTARYARSIQCPVLMEWGNLDNLVLQGETDKIYNAIASNEKKLVIYNGASHESFLRRDPLKWRIEVEHFLKVNKR
jgi:alpha-beta hydrolase superfamily lysophospholipase